MHYEISPDGVDWVAKRRSGPETVLTRPTSDSLRMAIRHDCCKADDGGYWVETMSGPPYYVAPLPATARVPNSTARQRPLEEGPRVVIFSGILLGGPKLDDSITEVFAEVEAERKADYGRAADLKNAREMRGLHDRDFKDPDGGQPEDH